MVWRVGLALVSVWLLVGSVAIAAPARAQEEACAGNPLATTSTVAPAAADEPAVADAPLWMTTDMTDVCTGETFSLADFRGKTVYVEPMATWCSNCYKQLTNVRAAQDLLASDDFVFVALSVETDLPNEMLAEYSKNENFPFVFAVLSPEMLQAIVDNFGREASVPPSTPHFVISPDGTTVSELATGFESPEDLAARLTEIHASAAA